MTDTDLLPLSHAADPDSSREAAATHAASGRLARHRAVVLGLVEAHPNRTACELWLLTASATRAELKEQQEIRRRLSDLRRDGLVTRGPQRRCGAKGTTQVTWRAVRVATREP